jgi:hypothetical protein
MCHHDFCGHNTIKDAALCRSCNPKRLTEGEFRAALSAMLDPRKVDPPLARILSDLDDLVKELESRAAKAAEMEN